jgi:transglutaminase-like putative cysteine protease
VIYDITHRTEYRFHRPVALGLHRLTFRPRDGHDMRVLATDLQVEPAAQRVDLVHDVYGNSVALVLPGGPADRLVITSSFTVEHLGSTPFERASGAESALMPPPYSAAERLALHPFLLPSHADPGHEVRRWAEPFCTPGPGQPPDGPRATIARMTQTIRERFTYTVRIEEGVQTPQQTLALGSGACRDFATLMIDALRHLGIAARFVSGYLHVPAQGAAHAGGGATHAWVQCFLPDSGWFAADPTNNLIGGSDLIRIAVARDAAEVSPLSGEWTGQPADFAGMSVDVQVVPREAGVTSASAPPPDSSPAHAPASAPAFAPAPAPDLAPEPAAA